MKQTNMAFETRMNCTTYLTSQSVLDGRSSFGINWFRFGVCTPNQELNLFKWINPTSTQRKRNENATTNCVVVADKPMFFHRNLILILILFVLNMFVHCLPQNENSLLESISSNLDCDHHSNNRLKRTATADFPDNSNDEDIFLGLRIHPFFRPFL